MTGAYVLDASVAAPWFLPPRDEPFSGQALGIQEDYLRGRVQLLAPDLLFPEVGNVLRKAAARGRISTRTEDDAIEELLRFHIPTAPCAPLLIHAQSIAQSSGRSVYDSIYVALSVLSGRPLLTADERLANSLASRFPIVWIGMLGVNAT